MKTNLFPVVLFIVFSLFVSCESDYKPAEQDGSKVSYPNGTVHYAYNVSATKMVAFSEGNLCYFSGEKVWRIAAEQWYLPGDYLFQWGNVSTPYEEGMYSTDYKNLDDNSDWGRACTIDNIDSTNNSWRCLTADEWQYLISNYQTTFGTITSGKAIIYGLFILPKEDNNNYGTLRLSMSEWKTYESKGVVFLPGTGYKDSNGVIQNISGYGYYDTYNSCYFHDIAYWTAALASDDDAFVFSCYSKNSNSMPATHDSYFVMPRSLHCAVRLVCDLN